MEGTPEHETAEQADATIIFECNVRGPDSWLR